MNIFFKIPSIKIMSGEYACCNSPSTGVLNKEVEFLCVIRETGMAKFSMQNLIGRMSSISLANEGCRLISKLFFCVLF